MKKITPEIIRELLHYEPSTGVFTWRERNRKWFASEGSCKSWNKRLAGSRAGHVWANEKGYQSRRIGVLGKSFLEHHLAWMYMTGKPAPDEIDHINQDATCNKWENLRASSRNQNTKNNSMRKNNTSGVNGVYWNKKNKKWQAYIGIKGRKRYLGLFAELDEAAMEAMESRAELGFSPIHGMQIARYHREVKGPGITRPHECRMLSDWNNGGDAA